MPGICWGANPVTRSQCTILLHTAIVLAYQKHTFLVQNSASEMTCIVSSGALNSTHSLTSGAKTVLNLNLQTSRAVNISGLNLLITKIHQLEH